MHIVVDACWIDTGYYCEFEQKPFPSHRFILFIDLIYIYMYIFFLFLIVYTLDWKEFLRSGPMTGRNATRESEETLGRWI